jgi:hypothetical protein
VKVGSGAFHVGDRFVRMGKAGVSDLLCVYKGRPIAAEVKKPGKQATDLQSDSRRRWRKAGGIAVVMTSADDANRLMELIDRNAFEPMI